MGRPSFRSVFRQLQSGWEGSPWYMSGLHSCQSFVERLTSSAYTERGRFQTILIQRLTRGVDALFALLVGQMTR